MPGPRRSTPKPKLVPGHRFTMRVVAVAALAARIASAGDRFLQAAAQAEELRCFEAPVTCLAGRLHGHAQVSDPCRTRSMSLISAACAWLPNSHDEEPAKSFLPVAPSDLSIASACSAYPKCVERGLTDGACCPSAGQRLVPAACVKPYHVRKHASC